MSTAISEEKDQNLASEITFREKLVISSLLFDPEVRTYCTHNHINDHFFENKVAKRLLQAFNAVALVGEEPTESRLIDQLNPKDLRERSQWSSTMEKIKEDYPPEPKDAFDAHLQILKSSFDNRVMKEIAEQTLRRIDRTSIEDLRKEENPVHTYLDSALYDLEEQKSSSPDSLSTSVTMTEGVVRTIDKMKTSLSSSATEQVTSGYREIDAALPGGFAKGNFCLIAARPAMGKTVVMLNLAIEAAKAGKKVLFVSIEMTLYQCFQRVLSKISDIEGKKMQQPKLLSQDDWTKLSKTAADVVDIYDDKFWMEEVTNLTVPQLERMIKKYKKKHDVDIVFIDYAQIMLTKEGNEPRESSDFAQISGGIRRAAKSQNVAIVVGSQLNRKVEERPDKRPMMSDIRNSGAFEQDAAQIIGLYRDYVYNKETPDKNLIELIFIKNRFGETPTLKMHLDLSKQSLYSPARVPTHT